MSTDPLNPFVTLLNNIISLFNIRRDKLGLHVSIGAIDSKGKIVCSFEENPREGDEIPKNFGGRIDII